MGTTSLEKGPSCELRQGQPNQMMVEILEARQQAELSFLLDKLPVAAQQQTLEAQRAKVQHMDKAAVERRIGELKAEIQDDQSDAKIHELSALLERQAELML